MIWIKNYKKMYEKELNKNQELKNIIQKNSNTASETCKTIERLRGSIAAKEYETINLENDISKLKSENQSLEARLKNRSNKNRELSGKVGGLTKHNNKLVKENDKLNSKIKELEDQIEDLKSDRYLVKKVPSGRPHGPQKTKIRVSAGNTARIRNYMIKEDEVKDESNNVSS